MNHSCILVLLKMIKKEAKYILVAEQGEAECLVTHKYRGSQQFSRVEYSTEIYWFDIRGAKEYSQVLAAELSIQPHLET